jgi:hypothetical protein
MDEDAQMCQILRIAPATLEKYKNICKTYKNETVLIKKSPLQDMDMLKYYLFSKNLFKNECAQCKSLPKWNNKPLYLMVHHKNKTASDNRLENLEIVCPNCLSQMDIANLKKNTNNVAKFQCDNCKDLLVKAKLNDGLCNSCFEYKMNSKFHKQDDVTIANNLLEDENIKNIQKIKSDLYGDGGNSRGLKKKLLESYNIMRYQMNEAAKDEIVVKSPSISRTPIVTKTIVDPDDLQ